MHIPDKHLSETVEDVMEEEGKKALKKPHPPTGGPMIKIIINAGPAAPCPGAKHNPGPPKPKKKKGIPGPMEDALVGAY